MADLATNLAGAGSSSLWTGALAGLWSGEYSQVGGFKATAGGTTAATVGIQASGTTGTTVARTPSSTNYISRRARIGCVTGAVAGTVVGVRGSGSAVLNGESGYGLISRFGVSAVSASMRWFSGVSLTFVPSNVDPASLTNTIGIGASVGTGNVQLFTNDGAGSAVPIDLGANFPNTVDAAYQLSLRTAPGSAPFYYRVHRLDTTVPDAVGVLTNDLPANNVFLNPQTWCTNNVDAQSVSLEFMEMLFYIPL